MENGYQGFPLTGRQSGQDAADSDGRELTAAEVRDSLALTQKPFHNPRMFTGYGRQRGWEREDTSGNEPPGNGDGFVDLPVEKAEQIGLPKEWLQ